MGIVCSREGRFQLAPSLARSYKKIKGSKNQPEVVYDWLQSIRGFPSVQYTEHRLETSGLLSATAVFPISKDVCLWKVAPKEDRAFLLEIYTNVCKNALNIHFIESLLSKKAYHVVLSVVVPPRLLARQEYQPNVIPNKIHYLRSVKKCNVAPMKTEGVSIMLYSIIPYATFLQEYQVLSQLPNPLIPLEIAGSPIAIQNVCYIALLCSNNNGGASMLNFIKDCHRHSFEMYALNAIPSAYSYYLLYGFQRTLDAKKLYPLWYDEDAKVVYYDVDSMSPDVFEKVKTRAHKDTLNPLVAFTNDGYEVGYLLTRLVRASRTSSASSASPSIL